jgi:hypothetical protein
VPPRAGIASGASNPPVPIQTPHAALTPSPLAVVHQPMRLSHPDPKEGSIPAYGADDTNNARARHAKKGGGIGVAAAIILVAAAVGGIGFFAMAKPGASADPSTTPGTDAPSVTSGTPTSSLVPTAPAMTGATAVPTITTSTVAPTSIPPGMIAIGDDLSGVTTKDGGAPVRSNAAHGANGGAGHGTGNTRSSSGDRTSSGTSDPKPAPALAPDPFGTPE